MGTDFLELFKHLETVEVSEPALYKLVDEAHSLILTQHRNSVPNTLRKFYECILYKCKKEDIKLVYKENGKYLDVSGTSRKLFEKEPDVYKNTIKPFLDFVNGCSHCYDADYATVKKTELYKCIGYTIDIWNWYAQRIRNLDSSYLIRGKYDLPEPQNLQSLEDKIKSKEAKIKDLQDKLAEYQSENKDLQDKLEEVVNVQEEDEGTQLDMKELECDILQTVNEFIKDDIYCTHRTIALFLLGDRIAQTDFKNLDERELFGKYANNKFTAFEYDMALQNLINQEDIIQIGVYYHPFDKNMGLLQKWMTIIKTKLYLKFKRNNGYKTKIDKKTIDIIQKAKSQGKKISVKYYKKKPNSVNVEISDRILTPVTLVPRDKKDEIKDETKWYTEDVYYLGAIDENDKESGIKTFLLSGLKNPKIK